MGVHDIVKQFTNALWNAKAFLQAECKGRYMPVECVGIVNNIYLFSGRFYESPKKVEACKIIAKRFVERIVYAEENMFDDELSVGFDEVDIDETEFCMHDVDEQKDIALLSMPVYFYDIKKGDISSVVGMLDEIEENGWT